MVQVIDNWMIGDGGLYNNEPAVILGVIEDKLDIVVYDKKEGKRLQIDPKDFIVKVRMIQEGAKVDSV